MKDVLKLNNSERLVTVKDYAEKQGLGKQAIYKAVWDGRLKSRKIGHFTFIVV